ALLVGGVAVLAAPGLASLLRPGTPAQWLLVAWIVSAIGLMYLPIGVERRFALGLQPVLTIAAAPAGVRLLRWLRRGHFPARVLVRPLLLSLLGLALVGSTLPAEITLFGIALNPEGGAPSARSTSEVGAAMLESPAAGPFYPLELDGVAT